MFTTSCRRIYRARPRFPIEVCEQIIDWVAAGRTTGICNLQVQRTLLACTLVCRAWQHRARKHLYARGDVTLKYVQVFGNTLRGLNNLSTIIVELNFIHSPPFLLSPLLAVHKFPNLRSLALGHLNLHGEHDMLYRAFAFHAIQNLRLSQLRSRKASHIIRFINHFRYLTSLKIEQFKFGALEYSGQVLPKAFNAPTRSLTTLALELIPGTSRLILWLIKAGPLLQNLKHLALTCENIQKKSQLCAAFDGVSQLLAYCADIEELGLHFLNIPMVDEISDICKLPYSSLVASAKVLTTVSFW